MSQAIGALAAVGNTPMIELRRVVPGSGARVLVKWEPANPTGSMKDRMAVEVIRAAALDGRLGPGGTVVEYTAGTTGVSLAFVCAVLGYRLHVVFSDAFSLEKRQTMRAFGAEITDEPSDEGRITAELIKRMIKTAGDISAQPGHWWADQLNNEDALRGYFSLGDEIAEQAGGRVDAFVQAVSTAHSIHGTTTTLRARVPDVQIVAVEPAESAVLSGEATGAHHIEASASGSFHRCGGRISWMRSRRSPALKRNTWRAGSRRRRASSPALPPVPMSSRRCGQPSICRHRRQWSPSPSTPASDTSARRHTPEERPYRASRYSH